MKNTLPGISKKLNTFLDLSKPLAKSHPFIVVILMHEYFRTLYPYDPFIKARYDKVDVKNISKCLDNNIKILQLFNNTGSYFNKSLNINKYLGKFEYQKKSKTQELFGKLWKERMRNNLLDSKKILEDSFKKNNFDIKFFKDKNILDMGCGSGRFTIALASFGAKSVIGVDLGVEGIKIGRANAKINKLKNVKFINASVLDLPFEDNTFDFVFCKGVLHHTGNLKKGLSEYYRVMKQKGSGFLYLYGSGGVFWNSRRKMRDIMKLIPLEYTIKVLDMIGMPAKRTIFVYSWYVPIEDHISKKEIENSFKKLGFSKFNRWKKGRKIELESVVFSKKKDASNLWGEGELRYILNK